MNVANLYQALSSATAPKDILRVGRPFALRTTLALLAEIEGLPIMVLSYTGTDLSDRFPKDVVPEPAQHVFKGELTRYQAWRRSLLDLQMLSDREVVDNDPIEGLQRLARLELAAWAMNPFYILKKVLPVGIKPRDLTLGLALQLGASLTGHDQANYRMALGLMDRLQGSELASNTGLLPREVIGQLPRDSDHRTHAPLPPRLAAEFESAPAPIRAAITFVYRLAVQCRVVDPSTDLTTAELIDAEKLASLRRLSPADLGFKRPSNNTWEIYLNRECEVL